MVGCVAAIVTMALPAQAQSAGNSSRTATVAGEVESPASAPSDAAGNYNPAQQMKHHSGAPVAQNGRNSQGRSFDMTSLWLQTAVVLGVVLGAMWLVLKWLRKRGIGVVFGGSSSAIQVLNRSYLTGKHQMVLVRFGGRILLLGVSPQGVNVLSEISGAEEAAQVLERLEGAKAGSASRDFQQAIGEAASQYVDETAAPPVVHTPSREQIGEIRGEIRGLLDKMQSLGRSRKTD